MKKVYNFSDYNKHLSLKFSFELWLIVFYFLRPFVLLVSTVQMGRGPKTGAVSGLKDLVYPDDFGFFIAFLATIPALFIVFAYAKRKPGASDFIKKIWRHGVNLLVFTAVLNIVIIFLPYLYKSGYGVNLYGWIQFVLAIFIAVILYTSDRVRDTFADFPSESPEEQSSGKR